MEQVRTVPYAGKIGEGMRKRLSLAVLVLAFVPPTYAEFDDFYTEAWDARCAGLGGIVSTQRGAIGVAGNPALLAGEKRYELLLSGDYVDEHYRFYYYPSPNTVDIHNNYKNFAAALASVRFENWCVGFGRYIVHDNDWRRTTHGFYMKPDLTLEGDVSHSEHAGDVFANALAVAWTPKGDSYLGFAFNYESGTTSEEYWHEPPRIPALRTEISYEAISAVIGCAREFRADSGDWLLGMLCRTGSPYELVHSAMRDGEKYTPDKTDKVIFPPVYQVGLSWRNEIISCAVEYRYVVWADFDDGEGKILNDKSSSMYGVLRYQDTRTWKLGVEGEPLSGLVLRAGGRTGNHHTKRNVPASLAPGGVARLVLPESVFTCGIGLLPEKLTPQFALAGNLELDLSLEYGLRGDLAEFHHDLTFLRSMLTVRLGV